MEPKEAALRAREVLEDYDAAAPDATALALAAVWREATPGAPPDLTPEQARLLRERGMEGARFQAADTPVPVLNAMGAEIGRQGRRRVAAFLPLARLLWDGYGREGRIVAAVALGPMELAEPEAVVPVVYAMARTCTSWEECDQLAMKAWEPVLRRDPEAWLDRFGSWVLDENKWVRRAAVTAIGRLPMKQAAYTARCVDLLAPALGDGDSDVKRALSFGLRLCARGEVQPVKRFLRDHGDATDADSVWVLCDVVRSLWHALLPEFADLLPVYRRMLDRAEPRARRSVEAAIRKLESA